MKEEITVMNLQAKECKKKKKEKRNASKSPEPGEKHGRVPSPHHSIEGPKPADMLNLVCTTYVCGIAVQTYICGIAFQI